HRVCPGGGQRQAARGRPRKADPWWEPTPGHRRDSIPGREAELEPVRRPEGGFGNRAAQAGCQGNPAQWIAEFLGRELQASGFMVLTSEDGAKDSALKIEGVLLKVFVEPVVGFWSTTVESDLSVRLVATSKTGLQAERTFFAKGEKTSVIWPQG